MVEMPNPEDAEILFQNRAYIQNLAKVESVEIRARISKPDFSATAVFGRNQVHVLLEGILDLDEEKRRLAKEIKKTKQELEFSDRKLSNKGFLDKAPTEIVDKVREKAESLRVKLKKLEKNLQFFQTIH